LKCRYRKWPCIGHLDTCSISYGQKKGRESNWQFDSRPLEVGNRLNLGVCKWSVTHRWKTLKESYKFASDFIPIGCLSKKLWCRKSPGNPNWDGFRTPPWESRDKKPFKRGCDGVTQRILYGGRWWLPPSPGRGDSCESKVACGLS
jgi:hypothetical protein